AVSIAIISGQLFSVRLLFHSHIITRSPTYFGCETPLSFSADSFHVGLCYNNHRNKSICIYHLSYQFDFISDNGGSIMLKHVLIVDDEESIVTLMVHILEKAGFITDKS